MSKENNHECNCNHEHDQEHECGCNHDHDGDCCNHQHDTVTLTLDNDETLECLDRLAFSMQMNRRIYRIIT